MYICDFLRAFEHAVVKTRPVPQKSRSKDVWGLFADSAFVKLETISGLQGVALAGDELRRCSL